MTVDGLVAGVQIGVCGNAALRLPDVEALQEMVNQLVAQVHQLFQCRRGGLVLVGVQPQIKAEAEPDAAIAQRLFSAVILVGRS